MWPRRSCLSPFVLPRASIRSAKAKHDPPIHRQQHNLTNLHKFPKTPEDPSSMWAQHGSSWPGPVGSFTSILSQHMSTGPAGSSHWWRRARASAASTSGLTSVRLWLMRWDQWVGREVWPRLTATRPASANAPVSAPLADHWRAPQYASSPTFFENNYGFAPEALERSAGPTPNLNSRGVEWLRPPVGVQWQSVRGFKTRRRTANSAGVPFKRTTESQSEAMTAQRDHLDRFQGRATKDTTDQIFMDLKPMLMEPNAVKQAIEMSYTKGTLHGISTAGGLDENKSAPSKSSRTTDLLKNAIIVAFIFGVGYVLATSSSVSGMIKSEVKMIVPQEIQVSFDDVRGCDEAKQELQEIVEFLMNPDKFTALGGKLPSGCLLVGPPGTGKTLLARAVAGQAGVPFFYAVGSEFDEVFVGQGARRLRDLFKTAKAHAPCVVFIDEIDSVGSHRSKSMLSPYANQTINQLLSEMDGFVANEGVIVLGASNRVGDLDKALLRPGRFDTQVEVPKPDLKGRKEILELYLSKIKHDSSVSIDTLAKMSIGFSGADLENMVNTSAIRAAVEGKSAVSMAEFEYSHDKHILGTNWKSRVRDEEELKITAYHEAGHTLVGYYTEHAQPLHKVTIVAKGNSGGHTAYLPEKERPISSKCQFVASMDVAMGGRAAEELIFGKEKVTAGCSSDLESATNIAEAMVKKLGMSEKLGLRVYSDPEPGSFAASSPLGPGTSETMDHEVNQLLNDSYKRASNILKTHRSQLEELAQALLSYETLDAEDVKAIIGGDMKSVEKKLSSFKKTILSSKDSKSSSTPESIPFGHPKTPTGKPDALVS